MDPQVKDPAGDVKRLQRCINDLVSLLALPAIWSGNEPAQIVDTLLGALLRMLNLDFVYARFKNPVDSGFLEIVRFADAPKLKVSPQEIGKMLVNRFGDEGERSLRTALDRFDDEHLSVFPVPLGVQGEMGLIVVGSDRADFPGQTESLLLSVAANQASLGLREAGFLSEQKRIADELDRRVAERTVELATANEELGKEIADPKLAEEALARSEAFLREGQHLSRTGSFSWCVKSGEIIWSEQMYRIFEFEPNTTVTLERIASRIHPEDLQLLSGIIDRLREGVSDFEYEHRLLMPDHSIKYLHLIAHGRRDAAGRFEYIGAAQDITQRRLSDEALGKARSELANVARVTSLGVLTASIAHEVNQPLSGIITNASTCLRMLSASPPNVEGACETARRTIRDGHRASDVITRLRTIYNKKEPALESMDLNEAVREVTALSSAEIQRNGVTLRQEFADDLPPAVGDRIQLQQVILNLLRNAADAMSTVDDRPRELLIRTERQDGNRVRVSVKDSGVGLTPEAADKIFEAFYTTKVDGMGIGLSVSRSIIEAHQGRLWATRNEGPGATFSFTVPCRAENAAGAESRIDAGDRRTSAA